MFCLVDFCAFELENHTQDPHGIQQLAVQDTICMDLSLIQVPSLGAGSQATSVRSLHLTFQTGKYCHQVDDDSINDERRY